MSPVFPRQPIDGQGQSPILHAHEDPSRVARDRALDTGRGGEGPHDRRHARDAACVRSGGVAERQAGRVRGSRHRLRGEQGPLRSVADQRRRHRPAPADLPPRQRHGPAVVARRQVGVFRVPSDGNGAGLADRGRRRRGGAGHQAAGRHQRLRSVPRWQAARRRDRCVARGPNARGLGQARRGQGEVQAQGADLRPAAVPPLGSMGGREVLASVRVVAREARGRARSHAGDVDRRADAPVRRHGRGRRISRRPHGRVREPQRGPGERLAHQHRRVPRTRRRRQGGQPHGRQQGLRQRPEVLARRQDDRRAPDEARRVRSGSRAHHPDRCRVAQAAGRDRGVGSLGRRHRVERRWQDDLHGHRQRRKSLAVLDRRGDRHPEAPRRQGHERQRDRRGRSPGVRARRPEEPRGALHRQARRQRATRDHPLQRRPGQEDRVG